MKVVGHLVDVNFHLSARIELNAKVLEEVIISGARDRMVVEVVGWFSEIDYGVVLHTKRGYEGRNIWWHYLHGSGEKKNSGDVC